LGMCAIEESSSRDGTVGIEDCGKNVENKQENKYIHCIPSASDCNIWSQNLIID
jgi:hypothetical protein